MCSCVKELLFVKKTKQWKVCVILKRAIKIGLIYIIDYFGCIFLFNTIIQQCHWVVIVNAIDQRLQIYIGGFDVITPKSFWCSLNVFLGLVNCYRLYYFLHSLFLKSIIHFILIQTLNTFIRIPCDDIYFSWTTGSLDFLSQYNFSLGH